jgi:multimeric flavodoxin WrbA
MAIGVFYYSRTGTTRKVAEQLADRLRGRDMPVDLVEIEAVRRPGFFAAGSAGYRQKELPIKTMSPDLGRYEMVFFGVPVWAGYPSPVLKTFIGMLPDGVQMPVACFLVGGSKVSDQERAIVALQTWVKKKGLLLRDPVLVVRGNRGEVREMSMSMDDFVSLVVPVAVSHRA